MADEHAEQSDVGIWDQATQAAGQAWDSAMETAGQAWDGAAQTAEQTWDTATETAGQAWDTATETAEQAWDTVTDAATTVWNDVSGGNPEVPGPSVVDSRVLPSPPSMFDLQLLAGEPPKAKAEWTYLSEGERITVLDLMTSFWGADFAQAFATTPADLGTDVDTISNLSHADAEARGFRFSREQGNFWIYYRPSGRTLHLQARWPDTAEPDDDSLEEEGFNEATNTAAIVELSKLSLPNLLEEYEQHRGESGDLARYQAAEAANNRLADQIRTGRELYDHWRATVPPARQIELEYIIDRIEQVAEWHNEYFPEFIDRLNAEGWPTE